MSFARLFFLIPLDRFPKEVEQRHKTAKMVRITGRFELLFAHHNKVLQSRCIDLAAKNGLPLHVLPFSQPKESSGTLIGQLPRVLSSALIYEDE